MKNKVKTEIIYGTEARDSLLVGMEKVNKVVSSSLGPRGLNTAIDKGHETIVIHDGFNISRKHLEALQILMRKSVQMFCIRL